MKNPSALLIIAAVAVAASSTSCSKAKNKSAQTQVDLVAVMSSSLAVPAPDRSYSVREQSAVRPSGANYSNLMITIIDPVAQGLKESNHHLSQAVLEGERKSSSMHIAHPRIAADLTGIRDDKFGVMKWSYTVGGTTYFGGTQRLNGLSGDLIFKAAGVSASGFNVHYDTVSGPSVPVSSVPASSKSQNAAQATAPVPTTGVVRHLNIVNAAAGNLNFTLTFTDSSKTPSLVTMKGIVGTTQVSGSWTFANGGSFTDTTGVLRCFDRALQDVNPCPSASAGQ